MRYTKTIEICNVCGKRFYGVPINNYGSYNYIKHTNFSNNIHAILARAEDIPRNERANVIVKEFFEDGNEKISKENAIEFLECFKHYARCDDKELLEEVFDKIQHEIDKQNRK